MANLAKDIEAKVLEEVKGYQLVKTRTITWERLDDDRYGEDTDEYKYSLTEKEKCPIDFSILTRDGHFVGVHIFHTSTTSWNAGLCKEESLSGCILYTDGTTLGDSTFTSSYDSPNNHDDVVITYSLRRVDETENN